MADVDFTLDELITPLTREECQASIYRVLGVLGVDTTSWFTGSVVRTVIVGTSSLMSALSQLQALAVRMGFLSLSSGSWLRMIARYDYGEPLDQFEAQYASGQLTLTNGGGGVYEAEPGELTFSSATNGKEYRNTSTVSLGAGQTASVDVRAVEPGAASTAAPNTITTMVTQWLGVTASNPNSIIGTDAASDTAVRTLCSAQLGSWSPNGPPDAYNYAVRTARRLDGSVLGITRTRITKDGYGGVTVYVASASGDLTADDLAIANAAVQAHAEPLAVTAVVANVVEVSVPVTYTAYVYEVSGQTAAQVKAAIAAKLVEFFRNQPIGGNIIAGGAGKIYADAIRAAIADAVPGTFHVVIDAPSGDVSLDAGQVAVLGTLTSNVSLTPSPEGFIP